VTADARSDELRTFHARWPGATDRVFGPCRLPDGGDSYAHLVDALDPRVRSVVDVGCGDGALASRVLARFPDADVVGVDVSPEELAHAGRRGLRARFVEAPAQAMPIDGPVDAVVSHLALMLMVPFDPVLAQIRRVLRPGGQLVAVVGGTSVASDVQKSVFAELDRVRTAPAGGWGDPRTRSEAGWTEILAGWEDVRFEPFHVARTLAPGALWSFLEVAYYPIGLLDPDGKAALRGWVERTLVEPVDWRFGLARVHARRR
jgi:SAM-dependent methyltransferase